jgi:hypothetical protein
MYFFGGGIKIILLRPVSPKLFDQYPFTQKRLFFVIMLFFAPSP